jgi:hypothetical protein
MLDLDEAGHTMTRAGVPNVYGSVDHYYAKLRESPGVSLYLSAYGMIRAVVTFDSKAPGECVGHISNIVAAVDMIQKERLPS